MFPYLLFISLTALAGGVMNIWKKFGIPAFTPVLLNAADDRVTVGCTALRAADPRAGLGRGRWRAATGLAVAALQAGHVPAAGFSLPR